MTAAHILYIPVIFMFGFVAGNLASARRSGETSASSSIFRKALIGSFLIFVVTFIGTHFFPLPKSSKAVTAALGGDIFDKKPSFTSEEVYSRIASFRPEGIIIYKQFNYTIDILFPLTLFVFLILLTIHAAKTATLSLSVSKIILAVPIAWFSLDLIENATIYSILDAYPKKSYFASSVLGYLTIAKFSFLLLSVIVPSALLIQRRKASDKANR
jgi:hypothetical protein